MKSLVTILFLCVITFSFSGCSSFLGDGRMSAWKDVRVAEEKTSQDILAVKKAEAENKQGGENQNPTMRLTAYDKEGNVVSVAEMDLQPVIAEITGGKKNTDTYGIPVNKTPMPKGELAENLEAGGDAVSKTASSPAVLAGTVGHFIKEAVRDSGGGTTTISGDTVEISDSLNTAEIHNIGQGNTVTYTGTSPAQVVEPTVVAEGSTVVTAQ